MTTSNQERATITAPTSELRKVLTGLSLFTSGDRPALKVARVEPRDGSTLEWVATDSYTLVAIITDAGHTLTEAASVDPDAILAALPKKAETSDTATLAVGGDEWQIQTGAITASGKTDGEQPFPKWEPLFSDQTEEMVPYQVDPDFLARLAKLAKTLGKDATVRHVSQGTRDGEPSADKPIVFVVNAPSATARVLIMPQRFRA